MRTVLVGLAALAVAAAAGCQAADEDRSEGAPVLVGEDKADGTGVEVAGWLKPSAPVASDIAAPQRLGFVFYASAGAVVDIEVTRTGSAPGLDTVLRVHGPRGADGSYRTTVGEDQDAGYGKLSLLRRLKLTSEGFYLAEVALGADPGGAKAFRLELRCGSGTCVSDKPVVVPGYEVRWTERSAEMRALARQAYQVAGARLDAMRATLPARWGVVLDIDETVLSNLTYQRERAELGLGYSSPSWLAWVKRRAATAMPGATEYLGKVRALGGKIVFVTNRKADGECAPTEANLAAVGLVYDAILCRTDASDKNARFESVAAGSARAALPALSIVQFVGDNIQDFPGLGQELRKAPAADFADFGGRFLLVPNPMYGSWEKNPD